MIHGYPQLTFAKETFLRVALGFDHRVRQSLACSGEAVSRIRLRRGQFEGQMLSLECWQTMQIGRQCRLRWPDRGEGGMLVVHWPLKSPMTRDCRPIAFCSWGLKCRDQRVLDYRCGHPLGGDMRPRPISMRLGRRRYARGRTVVAIPRANIGCQPKGRHWRQKSGATQR